MFVFSFECNGYKQIKDKREEREIDQCAAAYSVSMCTTVTYAKRVSYIVRKVTALSKAAC